MVNQGREKNSFLNLQEKTDVALVIMLYKQANLGLLASWICATVVLIYLYYFQSSEPAYVYAWYGFFLAVTFLRVMIVRTFLRTSSPQDHIALWSYLFIAGAFLSGVSWGFVGSPFLLPDDTEQQALIVVILAGVCAGSVPAFAPMRRTAIAFLVPALTPLIIGSIVTDGNIYLFLVLTFSAFFLYLIILSFKTHKIIKDSIQLQFDNESLVESLSNAKHQLELRNVRLTLDATHDPLTHVANRVLFEANFERSLTVAIAKHKILALLYLDLDKFKDVNDTYGHDAGDELLLIVVNRLKNTLRDQDILSRLGGDELAIILEDMDSIQDIADVAGRVCETIAQPMMLKAAEVQVCASVGIAIYPTDGNDMNTLLRVADQAMYYVKEHGGNNYHFNVPVEVK